MKWLQLGTIALVLACTAILTWRTEQSRMELRDEIRQEIYRIEFELRGHEGSTDFITWLVNDKKGPWPPIHQRERIQKFQRRDLEMSWSRLSPDYKR